MFWTFLIDCFLAVFVVFPNISWRSVSYCIVDLVIGVCHYFTKISLITGWIHHFLYIFMLFALIKWKIEGLFMIAAIMELPTISRRSNLNHLDIDILSFPHLNDFSLLCSSCDWTLEQGI